jgi:hypothetical protein
VLGKEALGMLYSSPILSVIHRDYFLAKIYILTVMVTKIQAFWDNA